MPMSPTENPSFYKTNMVHLGTVNINNNLIRDASAFPLSTRTHSTDRNDIQWKHRKVKC